MNKHILHQNVQEFITKNISTDITKLVLKGSPFDMVSMQELAAQITSKKKCEKKLPSWFATKNIYYPNKLNIEQTSSEATATYKSTLIKGENIIDITGGFGVDCYAFSKIFKSVTHCEINAVLSEIVKHNLEQLKVTNIKTIIGNGIDFIKNSTQKYDCIYLDPSRRDHVKKRVYLLEDCSPNLPENIDVLFNNTSVILVKTAPLLDIDAAIKELKFVKTIHIIAVDNEVKEVLYLLEKNYTNSINFATINIAKGKNQVFNFSKSTNSATYSLPKKYLFEPNAAILKAGAFQEISTLLSIDKLHKHSHLYTSDKFIDFPGRSFKIVQELAYQPKKIATYLDSNKANITIRNFPDTVAQIRKKTKLKDGGDSYLFFTTNLKEEKIVLVCIKTK